MKLSHLVFTRFLEQWGQISVSPLSYKIPLSEPDQDIVQLLLPQSYPGVKEAHDILRRHHAGENDKRVPVQDDDYGPYTGMQYGRLPVELAWMVW